HRRQAEECVLLEAPKEARLSGPTQVQHATTASQTYRTGPPAGAHRRLREHQRLTATPPCSPRPATRHASAAARTRARPSQLARLLHQQRGRVMIAALNFSPFP